MASASTKVEKKSGPSLMELQPMRDPFAARNRRREQQEDLSERKNEIFIQTASSGLNTAAGQISFDYGDRRLMGRSAFRIYSEMGDCPAAGTLLYLLRNIVRGVKFQVRAANESPEAEAAAQFIEECIDDLDEPWGDFVTKAVCQVMQYGHFPVQQVYKLRQGMLEVDSEDASSRHDDGKIGWACFAPIGQDTIFGWDFDHLNRIKGIFQQCTPRFEMIYIENSRLLNFKYDPYRDSPIGRSIFRRAWRPYLRKRQMEDIEAIGQERRLCGLPVIYAPEEVLDSDVENPYADTRDMLPDIVSNLRTDDQMGAVLPDMRDDKGNRTLELQLLTGGDSAGTDISKIIERYTNEIFRCMLADFLGLGQGESAGGSYAMHGSKTEIYLMGIRAYLRIVCDLINRVAIPRLFAVNAMPQNLCPEIDHSPLESVDIEATCAALANLSSAGFSVVDPDVLTRLFEIMGLPAPKEQEDALAIPDLSGGDTPDGRPIPKVVPQRDAPQDEVTQR